MGCQLGQPGEGPWELGARHRPPNCPSLSSVHKGKGWSWATSYPLLVSGGFQALMNAMGPSTPREHTPQYLDKTCHVQFQWLPPSPNAHAWTIGGPVCHMLSLVPPALPPTTVCGATSSPPGNPIVALRSQIPWINLVGFNVHKYSPAVTHHLCFC